MRWNMEKLMILLVLCLTCLAPVALGQAESRTYAETRKLLLKLDSSNYKNGVLPKLFSSADSIKADLEKALYDPDQKVSLNAQVIIKYVAENDLLAAFDRWVESRKASPGTYWMAPIKPVGEEKYLEGKGNDLPKLALKTFHPKDKSFWARVIAANKKYETVLIEVVNGEGAFTSGWHVVVRKEDGRWRILSYSLVWQS
jgi:hypothetical protein